jgi:hypothetical protein
MNITINSNVYEIGKIPAMTQFHIARRLAPLLRGAVGMDLTGLSIIRNAAGEPVSLDGDAGAALGPLLDVLAALKDEDVEYVINSCLNAVSMKQPGGAYAPVRANGVVMFPLGLPTMLHLSFEVIRENMSGFIDGLRSGSAGAGLTPTARG